MLGHEQRRPILPQSVGKDMRRPCQDALKVKAYRLPYLCIHVEAISAGSAPNSVVPS